jgi:hypothetical protein
MSATLLTYQKTSSAFKAPDLLIPYLEDPP